MDLKTLEDFDDILEYEAYVLTVLLINIDDKLKAGEVYETVLEYLNEHEGLDPPLAQQLGKAIKDAEEKETVH